MTALLSIRNLQVEGRRSGGDWRPILSDVSVDVRPGEVVAFIGESGAGKTTLALAALGYTRAGTRFVSGSAHLGGTDVLAASRVAKRHFRGRTVAYVAQSAAAALNPSMTIGRQVAEGLMLHRLADSNDRRKRVEELLTLLQLPDPPGVARRYPQQTSGGQQQRIMMAMAMSCEPKLLVLDEPTTALDVTTQIEVLKAIKDAILLKNAAAIYVSHDLAVVAQVASRIVVLRDGQLVEEGATEAILREPRHEYTRALLGAVRRVPGPAVLLDRGVSPGRTLLEATGVKASYGRPFLFQRARGTDVLRDVSIDLRAGETLALVGESGSGKSTFARVIAGLHRPLAGLVRLDGATLGPRVAARTREQLRRIQIVFQSPEQALNPRVTVGDAIGRAVEFYFGLQPRERRARVGELLDLVGLPAEFALRLPGDLSGGQRQRVAIARAFAAKPDVILCDEFLSALDTLVATRIVQLMARLKREHGVAYVFISHDLATVASIADRVAVMYAGRIVELGRTPDIFRPPRHPYTSLLVQSVPELRTTWLDEAIARRASAPHYDGRPLTDEACPFRNRCPVAIPETCSSRPPPARDFGNGHIVHCHHDAATLAATIH